jgi:hypothetical protein
MASPPALAGPKLSWTAVLDAHDAEVAGRTGARRFAWPLDQFK